MFLFLKILFLWFHKIKKIQMKFNLMSESIFIGKKLMHEISDSSEMGKPAK